VSLLPNAVTLRLDHFFAFSPISTSRWMASDSVGWSGSFSAQRTTEARISGEARNPIKDLCSPILRMRAAKLFISRLAATKSLPSPTSPGSRLH
jgi:hypothetical protein